MMDSATSDWVGVAFEKCQNIGVDALHETPARILQYHPVSMTTIIDSLNSLLFSDDSGNLDVNMWPPHPMLYYQGVVSLN